MKLKQLILLSAMLLNYFLPSVAGDHQRMDIDPQGLNNEEIAREILVLRDGLAAAARNQITTIGLYQEVRVAINDLSNTQAGRELPNSQQMLRDFQTQSEYLFYIIAERNQFLVEGNNRLQGLISQFQGLQSESMDEDTK